MLSSLRKGYTLNILSYLSLNFTYIFLESNFFVCSNLVTKINQNNFTYIKKYIFRQIWVYGLHVYVVFLFSLFVYKHVFI